MLTKIDVDGALSAIERDGYAILPGLVPEAILCDIEAALSADYARATAEGELFDGGGTISGHLNCYPGPMARPAFEAVRERGVTDIVASRTPEAVDRLRVTMNYNLPGSRDQHYHPDGLYVEEFLICNVAVVDTDLTNGAIDVLPGTHRQFYKFWQYALQRKYRSSTRVCMSRGDAIVRLSTVWHRGMANRSSAARPMLSFTFGEASAPPGDPFETPEGRAQFLPNWYGTDRAGALRERIFTTAPWSYSTLRFARSLVGNKGYSHW